MKSFIFSDLHLKPSDVFSEDGVLKIISLEIIKTKVKELNPDYVINLGDTFHTKDKVSAALLEIYRQFIVELSSKSIVIQLVGNHDYNIKTEKMTYHALQQYNIKNVITVSEYLQVGDFGFIAYCRTRDEFNYRIAKLKNITTLFGHLDINGFKLGDSYIETNGMLNTEDLAQLNIKLVISGHYHEPQSKKIKDLRFFYVGSVETTTFGESDQAKRFLILEGDKVTSIPTNRTMHKTLKIKAGDTLPELPQKDIDNGINYRIEVSGTKAELALVTNPPNYKAKITFDIRSDDNTRIEFQKDSTDDEIIEHYTDMEITNNYKDAGLDKEELIKLGKLILKQARFK